MDSTPTPEQWRRIETLFADVLDLPPERRIAFLVSACADDPSLYREVERLISAHDQADEFLLSLDAEQAARLIDTLDEVPAAGHAVGPYRIVRELGRGGMGVVYLAKRADGQFEQQVAVKVVKRGMDTDTILRRFLQERQILADLQHPRIARLLDGGMTDAGQPYFAMEHIEGAPLTEYCDAQCLDVDTRLRLFLNVAQAVQYAHRHLVIHRDLKPSNILVTEDGYVKLLDFGIAKLLNRDASGLLDDAAEGLTLQTDGGLRMMTPHYAAPEQVQGEPVTTATDVYSLGVVLYELLTGHRPYRFDRKTPEAVARVVADTRPVAPSTAVRQVEEMRHREGGTETITPEQVSRTRSTEPQRLRRRLAGDLDAIVLTALRKKPERRYASVEAFVEDVERHVAGQPVQARRDTLAYRTVKFVRRHRAGVMAACLVAIALVGALGASLWQANRAQQEAATAEAVKEFVVRLFEQADPDASPGEEVTARALLERSPEQIDRGLADQPKVQAEMLHVIGRLHVALGHYDEAEPLLQQALDLRRAHFGANHPETARTLSLLGELASEQSRYAEAERHLHEALQIHEATSASDPLDQARTLATLAIVNQRQGELEAAEELHRRALARRRSHLDPDHPDLAGSLSDLANTLRRRGDYGPETDSLYREALAIHRRYYGDLHSGTLGTMSSYAVFLQDKGDHAAADRLNRRGLELAREHYGAFHPEVGHRLYAMGRLASMQGRNATADSLLSQALSVYRTAYEDDHAYVGITLFGLGKVQEQLANYEEAERLLHRALRIYRQRYGDDHPYVAMNINQLARVAVAHDDYGEAERLYRQALDLYRRTQPTGHPITGTSLRELGVLLLEQARAAEAEPLLSEAEESWASAFDEDDRRLLEVRQDLGACLLALGRLEEAEALLLRIYPVLQDKYGGTDAQTTRTRETLVELYTAWGKLGQAARFQTPSPSR